MTHSTERRLCWTRVSGTSGRYHSCTKCRVNARHARSGWTWAQVCWLSLYQRTCSPTDQTAAAESVKTRIKVKSRHLLQTVRLDQFTSSQNIV